jgi:hypothetical protein
MEKKYLYTAVIIQMAAIVYLFGALQFIKIEFYKQEKFIAKNSKIWSKFQESYSKADDSKKAILVDGAVEYSKVFREGTLSLLRSNFAHTKKIFYLAALFNVVSMYFLFYIYARRR